MDYKKLFGFLEKEAKNVGKNRDGNRFNDYSRSIKFLESDLCQKAVNNNIAPINKRRIFPLVSLMEFTKERPYLMTAIFIILMLAVTPYLTNILSYGENESIKISLTYGNNVNYDADDDGIENLTGVIDFDINASFAWNVNESYLATRGDIYSLDNKAIKKELILFILVIILLAILSFYKIKVKEITPKTIIFAMALSGGAALIYEVVATQALMYFFNSSTYSVATVLVSFLLGLALGSLIISRYLPKIKNKENLFMILQVLTAVYAVLVLTKYDFIPTILSYFYNFIGNSFTLILIIKFLIGTIYLLFPTVMLGASFPLASSLIIKDVKNAGSDVGRLYSWDLFGAILGALIAGFILIPVYGLIITFVFGAVLNIIAGLLLCENKKAMLSVACLALIILTSFTIFSFNNEKASVISNSIDPNSAVSECFEGKDVLFAENSPYGEVRVVNDSNDGLVLYINRRYQCSEKQSQSTREMADIVLEKFENKIDVLNIGLGCGCTLNQILIHDNVKGVDMVEINPTVVKASDYFEETKKSLKDKRTKLITDDGSHYLATTTKKYNAVIIDIENPAIIHSSPLYTVEYFRIIKDALVDDGIFGLWAFEGGYEYEKTLYKSLRAVFKNVVVLKESVTPEQFIYVASNIDLNYNLAAEEKERINRLENDFDYQLNTLDHNALGMIYEKYNTDLINEEDKTVGGVYKYLGKS